ncbi:MAG TPA: L,D-transpeptidase family protein [Polyangiaceae bacterium]|nr:L,D-transpeptidase family protein [Polyangiaceae bacterium]
MRTLALLAVASVLACSSSPGADEPDARADANAGDSGATTDAATAADVVSSDVVVRPDVVSASDAATSDVATSEAAASDAPATAVTCMPPSALPIPSAITQALVVTTPSWTDFSGTMTQFERSSNGAWTAVASPIAVTVGETGLGWGRGLHGELTPPGCSGPTKAEGDGRSPAGVFTLGSVYGDTQGAGSFPYTLITPSLRCPDDPASSYYNEIVDENLVTPDWNSAEVMLRTDGLYHWVVFVNHNSSPRTPGGGSCIFIHVWGGPTAPTVGCTSLDGTALQTVLAWLKPQQAVEILLPQPVYAAVRNMWQLP